MQSTENERKIVATVMTMTCDTKTKLLLYTYEARIAMPKTKRSMNCRLGEQFVFTSEIDSVGETFSLLKGLFYI